MKPDFETLKKLYETERLTTRQIGAQFGVSKTQVLRWLQSYGIQPRDAHNGLVNRGIQEPTKDELYELVHVQHLSYRAIAAMFDVDQTAIPYWLKRYGIARPKVWDTRYKGARPTIPTAEEMLALYERYQSIEVISQQFHISTWKVGILARKYGINLNLNGWDGGKRFICQDGHQVRSTYELKVDDWLSEHGITHLYEPRLPFDRRYQADFSANGWYIEIWGVTNNSRYTERRKHKTRLYHQHNLPLIELEVHHFDSHHNKLWERRLAKVLQNAMQN